MGLIVLDLDEDVVDIAIAGPYESEPIAVVGEEVESYAHADLDQF